MKGLLWLLPVLFFQACMVFDVHLAGPGVGNRIEKIRVDPSQLRSDARGEVDLVSLCKGDRLLYVRFVMNSAEEIWCERRPESWKQVVERRR